MAYANVWGVPMAPDKGLFTETFENPAAPKIDNSKEWYEILLQKGLEAAGTAIGGPAGTAVAGSINDMYDQSKAMPTVGTVPQQKMAPGPMNYLQGPQVQNTQLASADIRVPSLHPDSRYNEDNIGVFPQNYIDLQNFEGFVGPMQPDFYNRNSQYYQGGSSYA